MINEPPKTRVNYSLYPFGAANLSEPIHNYLIDEEDNTVAGHHSETFYSLCESVIDYGEFLGFVCDDGGAGFTETRVTKHVLRGILDGKEAKEQPQ